MNRFKWYRKLKGGYWLLTDLGWRQVDDMEFVHYGCYAHKIEDWTNE